MLLHGCSFNESICLTGEKRFTGRLVKVYNHLRSLDTTFTRVGQLGRLETCLLIRTSDLYFYLSLFIPPPSPSHPRFTGRSVKVYYHLRSLDTNTRVGQLGKLETCLLIRTSDLYLSLFMPPSTEGEKEGGILLLSLV